MQPNEHVIEMSPSSTSHQSLQWTRPLLDELCQDIRQTVEEWSDPDAEPSNDGLDSAIDAARRMAGSLSVLEFQSGEMLGEAIASVLKRSRATTTSRARTRRSTL